MAERLLAVGTAGPPGARWPGHFPVGALRVVRWSARYDQTVIFYRDIIGLPVLETFTGSYGLDGTILGLPGARFTWRSSDWRTARPRRLGLISWCSTFPMRPLSSGSWHGLPPRVPTRLPRSATGKTTAA
jgi:YycE-like protein